MADAVEIEELKCRLAHAEAALRERETIEAVGRDWAEKYRTMFNLIDEGFCVVEVIEGDGSNPIDYRFIETNASFERQTGLFNAVGRRMREMEPHHEEHWFQRYSRIARTRTPERFEDRAEALGRWYDVYAFPIGTPEQRRVAILFRDVIERKRAELELLRSNELLRTTFDSSLQIIQLFKAVRNEMSEVVDFEWLLTNKQWDDRWGPRSGQSLLKENPAVVSSGVWDKFLDTLETGVPITHEIYYPHEQFDGWFLQTIAKAGDGILLSTLDITDRKRIEIALRDSESRFQQFGRASSDGLWIRDAGSLILEYASDAMEAIYGISKKAMTSDPMICQASIVPEDRAEAVSYIDRVKAGDSIVHEFRIQRPSNLEFRWIRSVAFPLVDSDGRITRIAGILSDVTEEKLLSEHQGVLLAELQHRVRNIMGMIRSMALRTSDGAEGVEEYRSLLEGRLLALSRVQVLLTRQANAGGSLREIIESEVSVQAGHHRQFELHGPDVRISPKAVEVLTLAFHELATNALKYGAFSSPNGRLHVQWETFEKRDRTWLALDWTESGAPSRGPVTRRGFGSDLIEGRIPYELGGMGKVEICPGGARCRLEFPIQDGASILGTDAPTSAAVFGGTLDMTNATRLTGWRVLVVEDDYYMAGDTAAALRGAGAVVLGPCSNEDATRDLLEGETPTHAVIDLNLAGGGPRFEIAHLLRARSVPFVFLTGYDPNVIPADFEDVVRLQKPLPFRDIVEALSRL